MAVTILEGLQNANHNLNNLRLNLVLYPLVKAQLNNAVTLLEKGYPVETLIEPLLEEYGRVEDVPEYQANAE